VEDDGFTPPRAPGACLPADASAWSYHRWGDIWTPACLRCGAPRPRRTTRRIIRTAEDRQPPFEGSNGIPEEGTPPPWL